ncbi:MAG TPA: lipoyl(octanoyl) transferase LipB, partial [Rhodocyclaceae bacterium]|nr:lipoyl(octanoyl) transferase LipB [Rhodocyclaceae bacterium]
MQTFTRERTSATLDELWLLQHPPVYTLGLAGKPEHLLEASDVPLIKIDRGGQITYHGPGQAVVYLLIDLTRRGLKVRELVKLMEQTLIDVLADWGIGAERRSGAP